jgi:hypothetical protein
MTAMDDSGADLIRQAIACGEFEKAQALWNSYAATLCTGIHRGVIPKTGLRPARELLEWARFSILCARAHAQSRLNTIHAAQQYGAARPVEPMRVRAKL